MGVTLSPLRELTCQLEPLGHLGASVARCGSQVRTGSCLIRSCTAEALNAGQLKGRNCAVYSHSSFDQPLLVHCQFLPGSIALVGLLSGLTQNFPSRPRMGLDAPLCVESPLDALCYFGVCMVELFLLPQACRRELGI